MLKVLLAILPSAGVLFLFWLGIKSLIEADRRERKAQAHWEAVTARGSTGPAPVAEPPAAAAPNGTGPVREVPPSGTDQPNGRR